MYDQNLNIVLVEPEIPMNTGNTGRTCVATKSMLHLVGPLGFEISDKRLKRAGLDYWPKLKWQYYDHWDLWWERIPDPERVFFMTTKAQKSLYQNQFQKGDWLVFGRETKGLDESILKKYSQQALTIPMPGEVRSLNLSNSVAICLFEASRQIHNF